MHLAVRLGGRHARLGRLLVMHLPVESHHLLVSPEHDDAKAQGDRGAPNHSRKEEGVVACIRIRVVGARDLRVGAEGVRPHRQACEGVAVGVCHAAGRQGDGVQRPGLQVPGQVHPQGVSVHLDFVRTERKLDVGPLLGILAEGSLGKCALDSAEPFQVDEVHLQVARVGGQDDLLAEGEGHPDGEVYTHCAIPGGDRLHQWGADVVKHELVGACIDAQEGHVTEVLHCPRVNQELARAALLAVGGGACKTLDADHQRTTLGEDVLTRRGEDADLADALEGHGQVRVVNDDVPIKGNLDIRSRPQLRARSRREALDHRGVAVLLLHAGAARGPRAAGASL
mmetsp:Transcript_7296/g.22971  ORF Transcript_7296/g.22971 Transcript_7296/m.22971 type:complete len:340 (-) Transcript_7296:994-2013(-)